ncbi:MAG: dihydroneopterin aldolase [Rubricella sp.]
MTETLATTVPDRIFLAEHVREVEIGAFGEERGHRQRLRFDITLDVAPDRAGLSDDVDRVLSYDLILAAIDAGLAAERLSLLETLAERIAAFCLEHPKVALARVRIEKLDRVPGALGVEIVRREGVLPAPETTAPRAALHLLGLRGIPPAPAMIALHDSHPVEAAEHARRIALLRMDEAAWAFAADDPGMIVAATRTEAEHAVLTGKIAVIAPMRLVLDAPEADPAPETGLAAWIARRLGVPLADPTEKGN